MPLMKFYYININIILLIITTILFCFIIIWSLWSKKEIRFQMNLVFNYYKSYFKQWRSSSMYIIASLFKIQTFIIKLKWAASSSQKQTHRLGLCCHVNTGKSQSETWFANWPWWRGRLFLLFGVMWRGVCYKLPVTFGFATRPTKQPTCPNAISEI